VRELNPRNPSAAFLTSFIFFNVTREAKVPAPFHFFCVFMNLINMNLHQSGLGQGNANALRLP
jgi:hypothetical protein